MSLRRVASAFLGAVGGSWSSQLRFVVFVLVAPSEIGTAYGLMIQGHDEHAVQTSRNAVAACSLALTETYK